MSRLGADARRAGGRSRAGVLESVGDRLPAFRGRPISGQRCGDPRQRGPLRDALPRLQPTGGYFNNLGALRSLGLIDYPEPGYMKAEPVLFLEG